MKILRLLVLTVIACACAMTSRAGAPAEVTDKTYLYEVVRYLYRWHLDERDVEPVSGVKQVDVRVRSFEPELDAGDKSLFVEIVIPVLRCRVLAKQSDYVIEEVGSEVKSRGFRIYRVSREDAPTDPAEGTEIVNLDLADLRDYLFRTRSQPDFPDEVLFDRLRTKLAERLLSAGETRPTGLQTVHLAPLSPVSNEWWVYWDNRKLLIRFTTDVDLTNPEVWEHEQVGIDTWDAFNQVVVSTDDAPGSNEFLTRDQIGRALYNCLVLGRRQDVTPRTE